MKFSGAGLMIMASLLFSAVSGPALPIVQLPPPAHQGKMPVEKALEKRRTMRQFANRGLELAQIFQLLWGTEILHLPPQHEPLLVMPVGYQH